MRLLVTGASGFIGSFIVEKSLELGHEVWAALRSTSSRKYLQDKRIHFIELNLDCPEQLQLQLERFTSLYPKGWDAVIHAAGATKGKNQNDFFRTNFQGTQNLVEALRAASILPQRFVFLSSLSVLGDVKQTFLPEIWQECI